MIGAMILSGFLGRVRERIAVARRGAVNAVKRRLSALRPYRPVDGGRDTMDQEYASGEWEYLRSIDELPRFSVVAGLCHFLKPEGSILEIGCGDGILHERLDRSRFNRFVGVDISAEAIDRVPAEPDGKSTFIAADARHYDPSGRFDLIIFNEVLEYFPDPLAVVRRYDPYLERGGLHIVSMYVTHDTVRWRKIWRMLEGRYEVLSATRVSNQHGLAWIVKALRPTGTIATDE